MGKLIIKRKITLEFLGEEYKDAYFTFKAVPVTEYDKISKEAKEGTNIEATNKALKLLKDKFIEGSFPDESGKMMPVDKSDLDDLDEYTLTECYKSILGQRQDPKLSAP